MQTSGQNNGACVLCLYQTFRNSDIQIQQFMNKKTFPCAPIRFHLFIKILWNMFFTAFCVYLLKKGPNIPVKNVQCSVGTSLSSIHHQYLITK